MRPEVEALVAELVARSRSEQGLDIDQFSDQVAALSVITFEIEELMNAYEAGGGILHAPSGGGNMKRLMTVLASARSLTSVLGRRPTVIEIAEHAKLDVIQVRHALAVGRVMGR